MSRSSCKYVRMSKCSDLISFALEYLNACDDTIDDIKFHNINTVYKLWKLYSIECPHILCNNVYIKLIPCGAVLRKFFDYYYYVTHDMIITLRNENNARDYQYIKTLIDSAYSSLYIAILSSDFRTFSFQMIDHHKMLAELLLDEKWKNCYNVMLSLSNLMLCIHYYILDHNKKSNSSTRYIDIYLEFSKSCRLIKLDTAYEFNKLFNWKWVSNQLIDLIEKINKE